MPALDAWLAWADRLPIVDRDGAPIMALPGATETGHRESAARLAAGARPSNAFRHCPTALQARKNKMKNVTAQRNGFRCRSTSIIFRRYAMALQAQQKSGDVDRWERRSPGVWDRSLCPI